MTQLEFELDFSHSEKEIAHYILNEGEKVLNLSIKELAKKTYTSPATIVRLCHKLGLEGYGDFKIKYSAELQFDLAHTDRIDTGKCKEDRLSFLDSIPRSGRDQSCPPTYGATI